MTHFDTPVGKFQILRNGEPTEFEVYYGEPAHFRCTNGCEIITTNSFVASISIKDCCVYDLISGVMETPILYYAGSVGGMDTMMCHRDNCTFELSTPYTYDYEDDPYSRFLPYESYSFDPHGFALRIVDDPSKYCT